MAINLLPLADHFEPAPQTKILLEHVDLVTVDLSRYHNGPDSRAELAERIRHAMVMQGFFLMVNHGFKPRRHWRTAGEVRDQIENFNVYRNMSLREQPQCMEPFKPKMQDFIDRTHTHVLFKLLRLFAVALRLDDKDLLVKLHDYDGRDESYVRYMQYYDAFMEEERKTTKGVWLAGHQDFTSLSLLFSQVSCN